MMLNERQKQIFLCLDENKNSFSIYLPIAFIICMIYLPVLLVITFSLPCIFIPLVELMTKFPLFHSVVSFMFCHCFVWMVIIFDSRCSILATVSTITISVNKSKCTSDWYIQRTKRTFRWQGNGQSYKKEIFSLST